jgi:GAF domain-containing protein
MALPSSVLCDPGDAQMGCNAMADAQRPSLDGDSPPDLVEAFGALQSLLLRTQGVNDFLVELAGLAAGVVEPPASCGITVRRDWQPLTVASSDELAEQVDEVQYGADSGPCLQALATGAVIDVPDLGAETRWPEYRAHALEQGVRSSLSLPLAVDGSTVGAMNLYGFTPRAFTSAVRQQTETFAAQAAAGLTLVLRNVLHAEESEQLEQALANRTIIDQALGILMAQQRCTADEAFALLRAQSQNSNRKLREVAADLITRITGRRPVPGASFVRHSSR